MASRIPGSPTLRQFLFRQRVLGLYRRILRTVRRVPDPADRTYVREWARREFRGNKTTSDEITIRMMISQGERHLQELEWALKLAKS